MDTVYHLNRSQSEIEHDTRSVLPKPCIECCLTTSFKFIFHYVCFIFCYLDGFSSFVFFICFNRNCVLVGKDEQNTHIKWSKQIDYLVFFNKSNSIVGENTVRNHLFIRALLFSLLLLWIILYSSLCFNAHLLFCSTQHVY